jgi:threonine synthase
MSEIEYTCAKCHGNIQITYDYPTIKRNVKISDIAESCEYSIWRYKELLPVGDSSRKPVAQIGWTPMYRAKELGSKLGLRNLYVKDDGRNPSASLKDRAGAVVVESP